MLQLSSWIDHSKCFVRQLESFTNKTHSYWWQHLNDLFSDFHPHTDDMPSGVICGSVSWLQGSWIDLQPSNHLTFTPPSQPQQPTCKIHLQQTLYLDNFLWKTLVCTNHMIWKMPLHQVTNHLRAVRLSSRENAPLSLMWHMLWEDKLSGKNQNEEAHSKTCELHRWWRAAATRQWTCAHIQYDLTL